MTSSRQASRPSACPSCGSTGRPVKPITVESLVIEEARVRAGRTDGFRFCAEPACEVAYFRPETGDRLLRSDVRVRIGQKETEPPRPVCYCFDHTAEEIEEEVHRTGTSRVPEEITEKCRQGLDRCEETNPRGACCLGDVRRALKEAQAKADTKAGSHGSVGGAAAFRWRGIEGDVSTMDSQSKAHTVPRLDAGSVAQAGALASAIVASACCWLPLLLIAAGISGGALSAAFEPWRPVFLPVTFALLGIAFYLTYRKPRMPATDGIGTRASGEACGYAPARGATETCCPPENSNGITLKKANKVILWVVTTFVLAFAFFPNYVGYLLGGGDTLAARSDLNRVNVKVDGMTCEACAAGIETALRAVPGVAGAEVSYDRGEAVVGLARGSKVPRKAILAAIAEAGDYKGRFADQFEGTIEE